jgi:hypothetical protein
MAIVKLNLWMFCVLGTTFLAVGALSTFTGIPFHAQTGGLVPAGVFLIVGGATSALGWFHVLALKKWRFSTKDLIFHTTWLAVTLAVIAQWPAATVVAVLAATLAFLWYERELFRSDLGSITSDKS